MARQEIAERALILNRPSWRRLLIMTGILFLAQAFPLPGVVRDAATFTWPQDFHWQVPLWHLIFTPFCTLADYLTALSLREQIVLQVWVLAGLFLGLSWRRALVAWAVWILFLAWGALVPRPMASLVSESPPSAD